MSFTLQEWHSSPILRQQWREIRNSEPFKKAMEVLQSVSPARVSPYKPTEKSGDERIGEVSGYQMALDNLENLAIELEEVKRLQESYGSIDPKTGKPKQE